MGRIGLKQIERNLTMPELPEVETIKNTLKLLVNGRTIQSVRIEWQRIIRHPNDPEHFKELLIGETFRNVSRKGKFLLFELDHVVLVSHLRMEGKYRVEHKSVPTDKHTHIVFELDGEEELRYHDVRKFGTMHVFSKEQVFSEKPLSKLGPDPFEEKFTVSYLYEKLQKTRRNIKAVLLDQTIVAGLGNIYVDEVLFRAKIHPLRIANQLSKEDVQRIYKYAKIVLDEAIQKGGTSIRSYVDGKGEMGMFQQELYVYGKTNEPCYQCGTKIDKIRVAGRGTHVCYVCQPIQEETYA